MYAIGFSLSVLKLFSYPIQKELKKYERNKKTMADFTCRKQ